MKRNPDHPCDQRKCLIMSKKGATVELGEQSDDDIGNGRLDPLSREAKPAAGDAVPKILRLGQGRDGRKIIVQFPILSMAPRPGQELRLNKGNRTHLVILKQDRQFLRRRGPSGTEKVYPNRRVNKGSGSNLLHRHLSPAARFIQVDPQRQFAAQGREKIQLFLAKKSFQAEHNGLRSSSRMNGPLSPPQQFIGKIECRPHKNLRLSMHTNCILDLHLCQCRVSPTPGRFWRATCRFLVVPSSRRGKWAEGCSAFSPRN